MFFLSRHNASLLFVHVAFSGTKSRTCLATFLALNSFIILTSIFYIANANIIRFSLLCIVCIYVYLLQYYNAFSVFSFPLHEIGGQDHDFCSSLAVGW